MINFKKYFNKYNEGMIFTSCFFILLFATSRILTSFIEVYPKKMQNIYVDLLIGAMAGLIGLFCHHIYFALTTKNHVKTEISMTYSPLTNDENRLEKLNELIEKHNEKKSKLDQETIQSEELMIKYYTEQRDNLLKKLAPQQNSIKVN